MTRAMLTTTARSVSRNQQALRPQQAIEGGSRLATTSIRPVLPKSGWRRLLDDDTDAVFGANDPAAAQGRSAIYEITFHTDGSGYKFARSGGCVPHVHLSARSLALFVVAAGQPLDPSTTDVAVNVTERACTGGTPMGDRLGSPLITYTNSSVEILYTASPLDGLQVPRVTPRPTSSSSSTGP